MDKACTGNQNIMKTDESIITVRVTRFFLFTVNLWLWLFKGENSIFKKILNTDSQKNV